MHRLTVWIALCAILLAALAPSISHAVAAAKGIPNGWTEICSVGGAKLIKLDGSVSDDSAPSEKIPHIEHCPFCRHHANGFALPSSADFLMPALEKSRILPALFYQASRPLYAWSVAQPRAPPRIS
jgi:hypothetical protein